LGILYDYLGANYSEELINYKAKMTVGLLGSGNIYKNYLHLCI